MYALIIRGHALSAMRERIGIEIAATTWCLRWMVPSQVVSTDSHPTEGNRDGVPEWILNNARIELG